MLDKVNAVMVMMGLFLSRSCCIFSLRRRLGHFLYAPALCLCKLFLHDPVLLLGSEQLFLGLAAAEDLFIVKCSLNSIDHRLSCIGCHRRCADRSPECGGCGRI